MMSKILNFFYQALKQFAHRLYLWTKPSYRRHRTTYQKQFDIKLQYTFWGCLLGMCLVALIPYVKERKPIEYIEDRIISDVSYPHSTPQRQEPSKEETLLHKTDDSIKSLLLTLNKNETLSGLLKRADLSMQEALNVSHALNLVFDVRKLRVGQTFELFFSQKNDLFLGLKMETNKGEIISVFKNTNGEFIPQTKEGIIETKYFALEGMIETTFSEAAQKARVPTSVVNQVIRALDGQIDFKKDLKSGEAFKIIYEQKMTDSGKQVGKSQLLYIALKTNKYTYQRYFFIDGMGVQGFYDENGESSPQTLLQRPLGKGRISSYFGMRTHPILGYKIQHKGVDFPAKTGTPIPAGADGIIKKIGRNGGHGKYIRIQHNKTYSTAYSHMDAFAPDLKVGSYVKKGEIIGYVGNTGRSTGPHLHYEVIQNSKHVNPLKTYVIPQRILKNQSLTDFKKKKSQIDALSTEN